MYTLLTTCPDYGSRNVGDRLIEFRLKEILAKLKGETRFLTIFREEPLEKYLEEINSCRAVLMPGFPVRDTPMHPGTYRLVEDLSRIRVPLIPVGANWNVYPGDAQSRREVRYSQATVDFLHYVAGQVPAVSCREHFVCGILKKHGIRNSIMTGDPAMFRLDCMGKPIHRPDKIEKLVFSPPLSPFYADQADCVMTLLAEQFPQARRYCAFHLAIEPDKTDGRTENSAAMRPEVIDKNRRIRDRALALGFEIWELAGDFERMKWYDTCDLHVGYECHAHLYFLSTRIPSVLIAEDARGIGFNDTIGAGGFCGFARAPAGSGIVRKKVTSGYCTERDELAVASPRADLDTAIGDFLEAEMQTGFRRYLGVAPWLDETYAKVMQPFIAALP